MERVDWTPDGTPVYSCDCGAKWLPALNAKGRELGIISEKFDVLQGGYRHGATAASAGTHDGGGAFDLAQYDDDTVRLVREMGGAGWHRTVAQGFDGDHCHIELIGCPHHPSADYQIVAYRDGYDGFGVDGYGGKDDGPRPDVIRTWGAGIEWANIGGLELTMGQYEDIMAELKAIHTQTHYDSGVVQNAIKDLPGKTVSRLLAVKWGDPNNNLGQMLTDIRKRLYGGK